MRRSRSAAATGVVLGIGLVMSACASGEGGATAPAPSAPASSSATAATSSAPSPTASLGPSASSSPTAPAPTQGHSSVLGAEALTTLRRAGIGTGWGPTRAEIRRAQSLVSGLSLPRLAGQVIVARYSGTTAPSALVNDLHLGGVIVMGDNIAGLPRLRRSNQALQASARRAGRAWPVFIGVDQEGGLVERVKGYATRFPAFMTAGAADRPRVTSRAAVASGAELRDLGFSVVFAPDADVTSGPGDPTIGSRSAGSRPRLVARTMNASVDGFLSAGILPVIKHFPGHGSVPADSHVELPVQRRSLARLRAVDLVPFAAGADGGVPSVMTGHIDVRAVDPGRPASLSRKVVTGLLRRELGFRGLVVTDALEMGAITRRYSSATSAVLALKAGNDVVLMPPDPRAARDGIVRAVRDGRLARTRLEQAAARQVAVLLHQRALRPALTRRPGTSGADSQRLSAAGATVVAGRCTGRLVGRSVRVSGPGDAVARFRSAAHRVGLGTGGGAHVALIGYHGGARTADVVVSMDTPYVLGASRAPTKIAMYGDTPGAMRALVDVLVGRRTAPGQLPVAVAGVRRSGC